jgi:prolyl-tRNA editing enzyme YbaK/EbsC (Cys-tRNA(Pro) deacylase)
MSDPTETRVLAELERRGVAFRREPCAPEHADTAVFCEVHGHSVDIAANALIVATKKEPRRFACCLVLGTRRLDVNGVVKQKLGGKCSFARAEEMKELTGMEVGGVTPFALPEGLPIWVCDAMMDHEEVIVGTGGRTSKLFVAPQALAELPGAEVVPGLSKARE